jgi:Tol biopolymer transport system component
MKFLPAIKACFWVYLFLAVALPSGLAQSPSRNFSFPKWSPDGNYLLYLSYENVSEIGSGDFELWVSSVTDKSQRMVFEFPSGSGFINYTWNKQSKAFVFLFRNPDKFTELNMFSLMTNEIVTLSRIPNGTPINQPVISPDGTKAAFIFENGGEYSVSIVDLLDSSNHPLTTPSEQGYWSIAWLSDENIALATINGLLIIRVEDGTILDSYPDLIAYDMDVNSDGKLLVNADMDEGNFEALLLSFVDAPINLTQGNFGQVNLPRWLDNNTIVFKSDKDGNWDIWKIDINAQNAENLTNDLTSRTFFPDVNPVTKQIAFALSTEGEIDIWIMEDNGSNLTKFTD